MSDEKFELTVDEDEFTIGDLEDFEEVVGENLLKVIQGEVVKDSDGKTVFDEKGRPLREMNLSSKAMKALIWIAKRRTEKGFTLDDARNVRISAITFGGDEDGSEEKSDPKDENGD